VTEYTPRTWQLGEVCQHGSLGRQCETCQAQHELAWAQGQLAACEAERDQLRTAYHDTGLALCSAAAERDHLAAQLDALLTAADDPRMGPDIPFERPPFTDVEPRLRPRKP
jgi:hypothetical protein